MIEGSRRHDWAMQSELMALIANVNSTKGKVFEGKDFNPYQRAVASVNVDILKSIFVKKSSR